MLGLLSYGALLLTLAVGAVLRPPIALAGVICLFGLKQWGQSSSALLAANPPFTNIAIGVLTVAAVLRAAFKRSCLFCRVPAAEICVILLFVYALVTLLWSLDLEDALDTWATASPYLAVVVLLAPLVVDDLDDVKTVFTWAMLLGGTICFLAVAFGTWGYRGLAVDARVAVGVLDTAPLELQTNPLSIAGIGGTAVIAAAMFLTERRRVLLKVLALCTIPFAFAVIIRSGSRGQLVALLPAVLVAGSVAFRLRGLRSWLSLGLLTALIVGLGFWATSFVDVDKSRWLGSQLATHDVEGRFEMAATVLDAALAHPFAIFFGLGNSSSLALLGIYPHITILEVLAEEGLPGIALYAAVLIYSVRSIRRTVRAVEDDPGRRIALAILAGVFAYELVLSWKQGSLLGSPYVFCCAIVLGRIEQSFAVFPAQQSTELTAVAPIRAFPNLMT
jgi:hypothetical protein